MTMHEMLTENRTQILEHCRVAMKESMHLTDAEGVDEGLVTLYNQLLEVVDLSTEEDSPETRQKIVKEAISDTESKKHAQDFHSRGYTIMQLVRGYGSLCQGITDFAQDNDKSITSAEFAQLNLCLDIAIAQAVTEFQKLEVSFTEKDERLKMGYLIRELRNSLSGAVLSHELIRSGRVGVNGSTSAIMTTAHTRMRELIDRSVAEFRMSADQELELSVFKLFHVVSEVESSLSSELNSKQLTVHADADSTLLVKADRHLMISAITHLVQNAIRFTPEGGNIWLQVYADGTDTVIEVEDQCGGLPAGKVEEMFKPYSFDGTEPNNLGFGLSMVRQAADLHGFVLAVRNVPKTGCVFSLRMPTYVAAETPLEKNLSD